MKDYGISIIGDENERAVSPVVGVVLLVGITVVLGGVVAGTMLGQSDETVAPHASLEPSVDLDADAIRLTHTAGDRLFDSRTRMVWTVDGQRFVTGPTESRTGLVAGQHTTVYFDGTTRSTGQWPSFESPGTVDIEASDRVELSVFDTRSNKPAYETSFRAGAKRESLDTGGGGSGGLLWLGDQTAGRSDVTVNVEFTVESGSNTIGNSLNSVEIEMANSSLSVFQGTGWSNVQTAGVDTDGDGAVDTSLLSDTDDWILMDGGSHLKIEFGGSAYTNVTAGDSIVVSFDGVTAPPAGVYSGEVQTSGDGNYQTDTIETT